MLKNREISIQLHKAEPSDPEARNTLSFEAKVKILKEAVKDIGKNVAIGIASYVLLDTFRKVQIEKNKRSWN